MKTQILEQDFDLDNEVEGVADWKDGPEEILRQIDEQIAKHGLEIVRLDDGGSDCVLWKIEKRT